MNPGEIIASDHINDIKDRSVQRYADAAARDLENPTPETGDLAYLVDIDLLQIFDGAAWSTMGYLPLSGGTLTGDIIIDDGETSTVVRVRREIGGVAGEALLAVTSDGGASLLLSNVRDGVSGFRMVLRDDSFEIQVGQGGRVLLAEDGGILRVGGGTVYLHTDGGVALHASTTRTYLYGTPNDSSGAAANMFINSTTFPGRVSISTAVTAFVDEGEVGPLTTRMGAGESPRGFDIGEVLGTIFDRFDAIEARLDALENP